MGGVIIDKTKLTLSFSILAKIPAQIDLMLVITIRLETYAAS
jgi:hypothetical protein